METQPLIKPKFVTAYEFYMTYDLFGVEYSTTVYISLEPAQTMEIGDINRFARDQIDKIHGKGFMNDAKLKYVVQRPPFFMR